MTVKAIASMGAWAGALLAAAISTSGWAAETYPNRPIRMVIPFGAGGSTDVLVRIVANRMPEGLGQQVVIDNRSGASGNIGMEVVVRAAPDGYTVGSNTVPFVANTFLYSRVPYDLLTDFVPVSLMATTANVLAVHPSVPARSVRELLQLAKSRPGTLNYGTAGVGSNPHVAGELFNYLGKVNLTAVHFKGGAPAVVAAMAAGVPFGATRTCHASNS